MQLNNKWTVYRDPPDPGYFPGESVIVYLRGDAPSYKIEKRGRILRVSPAGFYDIELDTEILHSVFHGCIRKIPPLEQLAEQAE